MLRHSVTVGPTGAPVLREVWCRVCDWSLHDDMTPTLSAIAGHVALAGHGVLFSTVQTCWAGLPNTGPETGEFTPRVDWLVTKSDAVRVAMRVHAFSPAAFTDAKCRGCSWRPHPKTPDASLMGVAVHAADMGHRVDFEVQERCEMYISADYAPTVMAYAAGLGQEVDMPSVEART